MLWSHKNDDRGRALESMILDNDLSLLNDTIKTRVSHSGEWSLLDLSLVHPSLCFNFNSQVLTDLHGSDHCPIIINLNGDLFENGNTSSQNYGEEFQSINRIEEEKPLNFSTKNKNLNYNKKFTLRDLKRSLQKSKNTSPGPDSIHYKNP